MTKRFVNEKTLGTVDALSELAKECDLPMAAFAIAWTLSRDFLGSTLVGATTVEQLDESLKAAEEELPADVLARCDEITRRIMYPMG
jgi:aryl-alcohol dehydrogenase-like predicted oxidoreductase